MFVNTFIGLLISLGKGSYGVEGSWVVIIVFFFVCSCVNVL